MLLKAMPALLLVLMTTFASAQNVLSGAMVANGETKPAILKDVGIDQKLGAQLPLDQVFNDENGKPVRLGSLLDGRPIILTLVYFRCPMLCTMVLNDLVQSMHQMKEKLGTDFDILTISFDPADTPQVARAKKANYLAAYGHSDGAAQWHFLTGSPSAIAAVTSAVGFRYVWDPDYKQFAHASGIMVLTPQGKISRYFYGVDYEPKDLRLALVEASGGKVGGLADQILLFCCQYDPTTGKYGLAVSRGLKAFGFLTICAVAALVLFAVRRRSAISLAASRGVGVAGQEALTHDSTG